jgi:hypothetical protein
VARVEVRLAAVENLDRTIITHSLPTDTWERIGRSLDILERFPMVGRQLEGRWRPLRFILGPWRWLLFVYAYDEHEDLVAVVAIQDARSSSAATSG